MTLAAMLRHDDDPSAIVAHGTARTVTRGEFWQLAARIARHLPEPGRGSQVALAFGHDRLAFAAALCGAWLRGHAAAIAENTRRERILPVLQHAQTVTLLHDTDSGRAHQVARLLAGERPGVATALASVDWPPPAAPVLSCSTRTADGRERWQTWTQSELRQLLDRLASELPLAADERVVHAFTPGFPAALFAACLLPLARGTPIDLDRPVDAAALAARSHQPGTRALLGCERTLAELAELPRRTTLAVRAGCQFWCPTALPPALRERLTFDVQQLPIDQAAEETIDHESGIDGLRRLDGIDDVAAFRPATAKTVLVAIAGPSARAVAAAPPPRSSAGDRLRVQAFAAIPRDENRQLLHADICLSFGLGREGQLVTDELSWSISHHEDHSCSLRTQVPTNYRYFEGHFTGYPVTAGAAQLHELVLPCLRQLCGELPALQQLDGVKFLSRFAPGDTIDVVLRRHDDPRRVAFEIRRDTTRCTAGQASFAAALPAFNPRDAAQ